MTTKKKSRKAATEDEDMPEAVSFATPILRECDELIKWLLSRPEAEPYAAPVEWELYGLHDYPEIIKKPMDLGTIQKKLTEGKYPSHDKFVSDVRLVWKNAMTYNRPDSDIYVTADKLSKAFERRLAKILKKHQTASQQTTGKRKRSEAKSAEATVVSRQDRLKLSQLVNQLSSDELGQIVDKIQQEAPQALAEDNEKIDIEINQLDPTTLLGLIDFAQQCVTKKRKTTAATAAAS